MRWLSNAIWTGGEPVSLSCVRKLLTNFSFASFANAKMALLNRSKPIYSTNRKKLNYGREGNIWLV